jgi:hypothetical protein
LEVEKSHATPSLNLQSNDSCDSPTSPNEDNKMEFIWRTQRGKRRIRRIRRINSPLNVDKNYEEATSMRRGYKIASLPMDFWRSLFAS